MADFNFLEDTTPISMHYASNFETVTIKPEAYVVPFTLGAKTVNVHYNDKLPYRGYIKCNLLEEGNGEDSCYLCMCGPKPSPRLSFPVFNIISGKVEALVCSCSESPGSLFPQLKCAFQGFKKSKKPAVFKINRVDKFTYDLQVIDLPKGADDGAAEIAAFQKGVKAGDIDITSVIPSYSNDELLSIPEVLRTLQVKGLI